ncbi:MAG: DUF5050 domain-containing protein [Clostridium sartagoforme]|nr:DUF5050 domain-containing protein [Clostridium sartagoforme]
MTKKIILLSIASLFIFAGCTKDNNEAIEEKDKFTLSTSYKESTTNNKNINFLGNTYSNTKYVFLGDLLFFPDSKSNEKLSIAKLSEDIDIVDDKSIIDSFDYNVNTLTTDGTYIYFSSISNDNGIYKLDYQKKEITKIHDSSASEIVYNGDKLYYINSKDNKIYSYSIKDKEVKLLSSSTAGNFIINNNFILYRNLSDNSKLYSLSTDGSINFKITDFSIDSFVIYNNDILFSNSNDNNYIYSINTSTFEIKKVLNISASKLKQYENNIYFINNEDPNSIYLLTSNNESNNFEYIKVFSSFVNDYYINEKRLFIESASDLDKVKIINLN